eukprot:Opistho-2@80277
MLSSSSSSSSASPPPSSPPSPGAASSARGGKREHKTQRSSSVADEEEDAASEKQQKQQQQPSAVSATAAGARQKARDPASRYWLLHALYVRRDYAACRPLIEELLRDRGEAAGSASNYALYVKALIHRHEGNIEASLQCFREAALGVDGDVACLKQVARSLYMLGRHKAALEVYDEAADMSKTDWEIAHNRGMCCLQMNRIDKAKQHFASALAMEPHHVTHVQFAGACVIEGDLPAALEQLQLALALDPEDARLLTMLGLLHLRMGNGMKAFDCLGNSLAHDGTDLKTVLAAGSILQEGGDVDAALSKYRSAGVRNPDSPQLRNNIGMCLFSKRKTYPAIACLKRAAYLAPFEWSVAHNLGLVHLHNGQHASAFHFLNAAINLRPTHGRTYMLLAVALVHLEDHETAFLAYEKAAELSRDDPLVRLNHAISLYNSGQRKRAAKELSAFESAMDAPARKVEDEDADAVMRDTASRLGAVLQLGEQHVQR